MVGANTFLKHAWWAGGTTLSCALLIELIFPTALSQYNISLSPLVWLVIAGALVWATHKQSLKRTKLSPASGRELLLTGGLILLASLIVGVVVWLATAQSIMAFLAGLYCLVVGSVLFLRWKWLALIAILSLSAAFYLQGYAVMPGDDGTPGMTYARWLAMEQQIDFENPIYPESHVPAYDSLIAAEFPLHTVLASVYSLAPDFNNILFLSNGVILGLFLCSLLSVFVCAKEIFEREDWAVVSVAIVSLMAFYGRAFWGAHFAQMLGMVVLPLYIMLLHRYVRDGSRQRLPFIGLVLILLFPLHVLTWLVAAVLTSVVLVMTQFLHKRYVWGVGLAVAQACLGSLAVWAAGHVSALARVLPTVVVETAYSQFPSLLKANLPPILGIVFLLLGGCILIQRRWWMLGLWFLGTWLLTQSAVIGVPFYATRFDEFFILPLGLILTMGVMTIVGWAGHSLAKQLTLSILCIVLIPSLVMYHLAIAQSYLSYSPPYHPTTIGQDDLDAFTWLGSHTPQDSLIIDVEKFGRFIPVLSGRKRSMLGLDVYTAATPALRWQAAKTVGANFIVWDEVLTNTHGTYLPYQSFSLDFNDPRYFNLVYENSSVKIFQVL